MGNQCPDQEVLITLQDHSWPVAELAADLIPCQRMLCDVARSTFGDKGTGYAAHLGERPGRRPEGLSVWLWDRSWVYEDEDEGDGDKKIPSTLPSTPKICTLQKPSFAYCLTSYVRYVRAYYPGDTRVCGWPVWPDQVLAKKPSENSSRLQRAKLNPRGMGLIYTLGRKADICPGHRGRLQRVFRG